jgi:hypothetical protein
MPRALFGPSREEIWRQLSDEIGAQFVDGGFWKGDKIVAKHQEWTVTLDTYTVSTGKSSTTFTRMRAPFFNPHEFRFTIYRRSVFTGIATRFGMQDIEVHDELFDRDFVVKSTNESAVLELLANSRIRELIAAQPRINLTVKDDEGWFGPSFPDGVDELYFSAAGVMKDVERLKQLYALFAETLDHLCHIRQTYEQAPDVAL